jgi:SAM-dependent methyltransferase
MATYRGGGHPPGLRGKRGRVRGTHAQLPGLVHPAWGIARLRGRARRPGTRRRRGAGRDAQFLASLSNHVIALDATHELLAHVPDGPGLARLRGDVQRIPLRDTSVGRIWCSGVLLHMEEADLIACLSEFGRILEPGGVTQLSVKEGTGRTAEPVPGGQKLLRHFFHYRADDIIPLAKRAGFTVDCAWTVTDRDSSEVEQRWLKLRLIKAPS